MTEPQAQPLIPERTRRLVFPTLFALFVVSLLGFAWQAWAYRSQSARLDERSAARASTSAERGAKEVETNLRRVMDLADALAADLAKAPIPADTASRETVVGKLAARVHDTVYADPDLAEMGVAFAPFAFDPDVRLRGVAYEARGAGVNPVALDAARDYTEPGTDWYLRPLSEGPVWLEPSTTETLRATYAVPFTRGTGTSPTGVVYVTYALAHLGTRLDALDLDLGDAGYVTVLSAAAHFVAHPDRERLDGRRTMGHPDDPGLAALSAEALAGQPVVGAVAAVGSGDTSWAAFLPIPAAHWAIGAVVDRSDERSPEAERRALITLALTLAVALAIGVALAVRIDRGTSSAFWATSVAMSMLALGSTTYVLSLVYRIPDAPHRRAEIASNASLRRAVLEQEGTALTHGGPPPLTLPTGLMIQSITFVTGQDIRVTGYLWQRYADAAFEGVVRGFLIPVADSLDVVETYRQRAGDAELVGWSFKATLHQDFNYARFPFGEERVRIPFWPKDFSHGILLVPDVDAYAEISPRALPGLREGLVMPSWDIKESVFSYAPQTYHTRFGFIGATPQATLPELEFDITGRKQINGPFVTYLLPITVVMIMAFSILVLTSREEKRMKFLGFDALKVITACAGFFLVVIFSQIDLRKTLATRDIVYLENFHLTAYLAILAVALNAILYALTDGGVLHYRDNLVPKLLFWPVIQLGILSFTLLTFY